MKNNLIVKRNDFLKFGYSLSLTEQRLLLACISKVDSRVLLEKEHQFEVRVQEIQDIFGNENSKQFYRDLKLACRRLFNRKIVIIDDDGNIEELRWVWKIKYYVDETKIVLNFSPDVAPFLSAITERFTQYKLDDVKQFKCIHSLRIYELLAEYQGLAQYKGNVGHREIDVDEIRRLLDLGKKYPSFGELKRSVIDKAVDEINTYSNMTVSIGYRKRGRKVLAILFEFKIHKKTKQDQEAFQKRITVDDFVRQNPGITKGKTLLEVQKMMLKING